MATADRLDCLIQETPEAAARCTIIDERRPLIDACAEDGGEPWASQCALTLAEPGAVLLESRIRPLVDGSWLDLWSCHAPEDGELAPEEGPLLICGLQVLREISREDCAHGQIRPEHCASRWNLQVPQVERWLTRQLQPQAG